MSPDQFWDFTPRLFQLKLEGRQKADFEIQRAEWERMRYQTVCLINKDRKRKDQIKLKDLVSFDWEKKINKEGSKSDYKKAMYLIAKSNREREKNQ
tara:strand:+ start:161 stop:448 length:288 start_codon:yes stop_codon:yes gene_type:complete